MNLFNSLFKRLKSQHIQVFVIFLGLFLTSLFFQNCSDGFKIQDVESVVNQNSLGTPIVPPEVIPPTTTPPEVLTGQKLYATNCMICHSDVGGSPSKKGKSANDINQAITGIPGMASYQPLKALTAGQIQLIAEYLSPKVACNPVFNPQRVPARLLSHDEYDNIISDLFSYPQKLSNQARFELMTGGTSGFSNDTGSIKITDLMIDKYWNAAVLVGEDVITKKGAQNSAFSRIASCSTGSTLVSDACHNTIVRGLTLKTWRRPVNEVGATSEFVRLKAILKAGSTLDQGLKDLITALLISPNFLIISNVPNTTLAAGSSFALDSFQMATRLSLFLWQSTPDDALLTAAQNNQLATPDLLKAQIVRMIRDAKSKRLAAVLSNEWIGIGKLPNLGLTAIPTTTINSMMTETRMMFENIMTEDSSFSNALTADYSYLNQTLAQYYGVTFNGSDANAFYKIDMRSTPRRGVLNQAAFLIATAGSPNETHPVTRGKVIANRIACAEIGDPPPLAGMTPITGLPANAIPAERLAVHTQNVSCRSCHVTLDPYGLALETYDPFGKWRTTYAQLGNRTVPQNGTLVTGENYNSTTEYMSALSGSKNVKSCVAKRVLSLAVSRAPSSAEDQCVADQVSQMHLNPQSRFSDLIYALATSRQFNMQTTEAP